ncbi:sialic acid-binding Ig-like lectin 5 isoform X2 [Takifugu flavidus]|uniref:Ig-like domain-containing protein n=1 Tax=Takifugu flavidus TaxID=433684 RepID=A0A5C6PL60_9TELE|nr:sialic acid-binding Ig-like lectin 5 isoform X2 [Takifugu flavidus]TWW80113.1 hypothetical protein D4764_10G0011430 [Takifugu flavidus]
MLVDSLLFVCPLLFAALCRGIQTLVPSVPDQIQALVGSCVIIPCSFTPPAPHFHRKAKKETVSIRLSFRGGSHFFPLRSTAFNSEDQDQMSREFHGRTALFGQITNGDCSLKIERIRMDDARVFEVALKRADDFLWGKPRRFNLDVVDTPEAPIISGMLTATEGQLVSVNCSVNYYCPSRPPILQWIWERGDQLNITKPPEIQTVFPEHHRPLMLASLSFTVSHRVKPRLRCEASYPGAKALTASKDLHVTFSPKDVAVQVESKIVKEGGNALLVCTCKADPPAFQYHWSYSQQGRTMYLRQRTHTVRVFNVTRDMRVRCSAQNLIGRGESQLTPLNILYKPVILQVSSTCVLEDSVVTCHCSVDSNPKAAVTWSVNGTVPPHDYNLSVTSQPDELTAVLRGHMDAPQTVICFAVNILGNDSLLLLLPAGGGETLSLSMVLIPAAAICSVLLLLLVFYCCCCCYRKRAKKEILNRDPVMYPGGTGISTDQMSLYINCTEVTHIYTNGSYQLVYQNSTPLFVHTKQVCPMGRRGGERRRRRQQTRRRGGAGGGDVGVDRIGGLGVREIREEDGRAVADAETAIYLEIL